VALPARDVRPCGPRASRPNPGALRRSGARRRDVRGVGPSSSSMLERIDCHERAAIGRRCAAGCPVRSRRALFFEPGRERRGAR